MNDIQHNLPVDQQLELLKRGVVDLVSEADLKTRLERGTPLRVKLGADPTRPDLHLGHAVILRKMRQFQDLGHKVIMLIGDFTATIGDPTGKSKTRPPLTLEEARANAQSYLEQCRIILRQEPEVLEVRYNSEWLERLGYKDIIQLASRYTVARIMERDDFKKRFEGGVPISVHELLYPLTQGYDSVALEADVELGGTDQLFNNLVGRALQRDYGQAAQIVMTLPLLVGTDGTEKMSKSLDNYIGLQTSREEVYRDLMKIKDNALPSYLELLTDLTSRQIEKTIGLSYPFSHQVLATLVSNWIESKGDSKADLDTLREIDYSLYILLMNSKEIEEVVNSYYENSTRSSVVPNGVLDIEIIHMINEINIDKTSLSNEHKLTQNTVEKYSLVADEIYGKHALEISRILDITYSSLTSLHEFNKNIKEILDNNKIYTENLLPALASLDIKKFRESSNISNLLPLPLPSFDFEKLKDLTRDTEKLLAPLAFIDNQKAKQLIDTSNMLPLPLPSFDFEKLKDLTRDTEKLLAPLAFIDNQKAKERYRSVAKGGIPDNLPEISVPASELNEAGQIAAAKLVALAGLEPSNGAARKLIQNRGLKIGGEVYTDPQGLLTLPAEGLVLQKGKDKFIRAVLQG